MIHRIALALLVCLVAFPSMLSAQSGSYSGICEQGNTSVVVPGTQGSGSQKFQRSYPQCTVTVYAAGTVTPSTIYSDNALTALANPFTAGSSGRFAFYAADGAYDVKLSGGGIAAPFTIGNIQIGGPTLNCANFPGANMGAKIANCISALPTTGGVADACLIRGVQTISQDMFSGVTKPGELRVCSGTFTVSTYQSVPSNWTIRGVGESSNFIASSLALPFVPDSTSSSALFYVVASATGVTIRDIYVQGIYSGTGVSSTTFGIKVGLLTQNVSIINNIVTNNSWSGILLQGDGHIVQGNYTGHNAIDGIESFATNTRIAGNRDYDGAAASANGVGCIEILPGSSNVSILNNICETSNNSGIVLSSGGTVPNTIIIDGNTVSNPGARGIVDNGSSINVTITNNIVNTTRGVGALGYGIYLANTNRFIIANNTVVSAKVGNGPSGIQIEGTCDSGTISGNITYDNWVGIGIGGSCGTNTPILIQGNVSYSNTSGLDYSNSSSGTKVFSTINAFGTSTITSTLPSLTVPAITGGTAVGSEIVLTGTTANGTATGAAVEVKVGNNGGTLATRWCNNANIVIGDTSCSLTENVGIVNKTLGVHSTSATDAIMYGINANGSGRIWSLRSRNDGGFRLYDDSGALFGWAVNTSHNFAVQSLAAATGNTLCYDTTTIATVLTLTTCTSLRALKDDIRPLPATLSDFMKLSPVAYTQKNDGVKRFGFVAEDVHDVNETLASYHLGELRGVDYNAITALLVKIVQQQQRDIRTLKNRLK